MFVSMSKEFGNSVCRGRGTGRGTLSKPKINTVYSLTAAVKGQDACGGTRADALKSRLLE